MDNYLNRDRDITYSYDDRGLMLSASDPAGAATATSYVYDSNGRMIERVDGAGAHGFGWTSRNELDTLVDPVTGITLDYGWTAASEPDIITYGTTGLTRDYGYDDRGLLESDTLSSGAGTVSSFGYLYDADGNVESKDINMAGNPMSGTHQYDYDEGGRLVSWDAPSQTLVAYGWDDSGNRISAGTDTYQYDYRNRLITGPDGDYTYTPRGTLSQIGASTYSFDPLGRLTDYDSTVAYSYDGLDRVATRATDTFSYAGMGIDPTR